LQIAISPSSDASIPQAVQPRRGYAGFYAMLPTKAINSQAKGVLIPLLAISVGHTDMDGWSNNSLSLTNVP
jgi:hypothetical protein